MFKSFRIARVFGIPVQVHWTFSLLLIWIAYEGYAGGAGWFNTGIIGLIILSLFFCVILHEFGHALAARRYGIDTRDITISPIGGIARLNGMPEKPIQEMWVALAGPLVNLVLALFFMLLFYVLSGADWELMRITFYGYILRDENYFMDFSMFEFFLISLISGNIILAVFNLLPAFPMDGGRVLRALLARQMGRPRATRIAAFVGQAFAVALAGYGFMAGMEVTGLVGLFVFFAATQENRSVQYEHVVSQFTVSDAVRYQFSTISENDPIEAAFHKLKHGLERNFLVVSEENGTVTGFIESKSILEGVRADRQNEPISGIARPIDYFLTQDQSLKDAVQGFQDNDTEILPVFGGDGSVVGVVDRIGIEQFLESFSRDTKKPFFFKSGKSKLHGPAQ